MRPLADYRPQPRAGRLWAVLQFPLTRIVVAAVLIGGIVGGAQVLILSVAGSLGMDQSSLFIALLCFAAALMAPALYAGFVVLVERRHVVELGTAGVGRELGAGFALGAGLYAVAMLVLLLAGCARLTAGDGPAALVTALVVTAGTAISEEVLFRGVIFRILEERLGSWLALALSGAMFGALHLLNPGYGPLAPFAIAIEAGVLLGAAYMVTRRLWLPIALHAGWNFAQSGVFGVASSGTGHGLLATELRGPALLTGGGSPESSLLALALCLAAATGLLALARRRGLIVPPSWTKRAGG